MVKVLALAFVLVLSVFGCAVKQNTTIPELRAKPLSLPAQSTEPLVLTNPEHRLAEARLGTPSGLGASTRRVDAPAAHSSDVDPNEPRVALDLSAEELRTR